MARKPLVGTVAATVLEFGTGALNIDATRIDGTPGRWPANVALDEQAAALLDQQTGELHTQDPATRCRKSPTRANHENGTVQFGDRETGAGGFGDRGGASRFFYVAKASSRERNAGVDDRNVHPTVKPIALMRWLVRLVTPPDGTILDPFAGSGTTGCAATLENLNFVGIERDPEYARIAQARIAWWEQHPDGVELTARIQAERDRQTTTDHGQDALFDHAPVAPPRPQGSRDGEPSAERRYTNSGGSNFAMKPGRRRP